MSEHSLRVALISTDSDVAQVVGEVVLASGTSLTLGLELTMPLSEFGEREVGSLRSLDPEIVILDFEEAPELGVRFAQFIAEQSPHRRFIAVGPPLSHDLLLEAMRAGVDDYLIKPVSVDVLQAAVNRMSARVNRPSGERPRQPGAVFAFTSAKGGAGSTTIATNLAITIHQLTAKKTLVVDLELQLGEVALFLGVQPRFNFVDMVQNFHRMDAGLLASFIERHSSGVHVLSAPYHPERAEAVTPDQIRRILQFLRQHYDYVLVDTSKSLLPSTLAVFEQSDLVFLVTGADLQSIRNVQRGLPLIRRALVGGDQQIRVLINRFGNDEAIERADIERALDLKVFWTLSNDYEAAIASVNTGKPIVLGGSSKCGRDLRALGSELAGLSTASRNGRTRNPIRQLWQRVNKPKAKEAKSDE